MLSSITFESCKRVCTDSEGHLYMVACLSAFSLPIISMLRIAGVDVVSTRSHSPGGKLVTSFGLRVWGKLALGSPRMPSIHHSASSYVPGARKNWAMKGCPLDLVRNLGHCARGEAGASIKAVQTLGHFSLTFCAHQWGILKTRPIIPAWMC